MENEIYGTVMVVGFDIIAILFCILLLSESNVWANIGGVVLACVALYATYSVAKFWYHKLKEHCGNGDEEEGTEG